MVHNGKLVGIVNFGKLIQMKIWLVGHYTINAKKCCFSCFIYTFFVGIFQLFHVLLGCLMALLKCPTSMIGYKRIKSNNKKNF